VVVVHPLSSFVCVSRTRTGFFYSLRAAPPNIFKSTHLGGATYIKRGPFCYRAGFLKQKWDIVALLSSPPHRGGPPWVEKKTLGSLFIILLYGVLKKPQNMSPGEKNIPPKNR